jgi:hypothetical protein
LLKIRPDLPTAVKPFNWVVLFWPLKTGRPVPKAPAELPS